MPAPRSGEVSARWPSSARRATARAPCGPGRSPPARGCGSPPSRSGTTSRPNRWPGPGGHGSISTGSALRPGPPPAYKSPAWQAEADTVVRTNAELTDDQTRIARFWADGAGTDTPPGHWLRIAIDLSARDHLGMAATARVLAHLAMAEADAFIACWDAKYTYWSGRPAELIPGLRLDDHHPELPVVHLRSFDRLGGQFGGPVGILPGPRRVAAGAGRGGRDLAPVRRDPLAVRQRSGPGRRTADRDHRRRPGRPRRAAAVTRAPAGTPHQDPGDARSRAGIRLPLTADCRQPHHAVRGRRRLEEGLGEWP